ncbi:DUF2283 domain-containing protein [Thermococcus sp. 9N3]|uniref:DUF2283 domain-containing protein n=1 Tax=Thermococcus sp. 9N3 TaxID=163002 RepID=UPI00143013AF|nr:DUF2283 domain-containing protein [Thermococcus sp. 9N3]NJE48461.1 DUF2283 domain-containing protein [Thermococcus sp. 9N3]
MERSVRGVQPIDYDPVVDSLFVSVPNRKYEYSIMVGDDLILDFGRIPSSEKQTIVGFELLNASEKFGIDRHLLKNIRRLHAEITIDEKTVKLKLSLVISHRRKERERSKVLEVANLGVPPMVSSINI